MNWTDTKRRTAWLAACAAVSVGVGIYASVVLGRMTASVVFLMIAAATLGWVVWVAFRAAESLVREPPAVEIAAATGRRRKELEREKSLLLKALKELEFDHEMGKVSDSDYQEIGGNYRARAMRILRQLDAASGDVDYRSLVERDLANRTKAKPAEEAPAKREGCASCGTKNDPDADFCKKCGKKLEAA
jgi:hypothetical protein